MTLPQFPPGTHPVNVDPTDADWASSAELVLSSAFNRSEQTKLYLHLLYTVYVYMVLLACQPLSSEKATEWWSSNPIEQVYPHFLHRYSATSVMDLYGEACILTLILFVSTDSWLVSYMAANSDFLLTFQGECFIACDAIQIQHDTTAAQSYRLYTLL